MKRSPIVAALCALAFALTAAAAPQAAKPAADDILPFKAVEKTLANGLKVIIVPTGFPNIVSVQIPVQTGSRNEVEPGKSGFAHFFEHVMFRGTKKYPPDVYTSIITKAGARQNAFTSDDLTNYHTTFAKEDLEKILEIEADRFQNLSYSEELFKTEARAVLGEYNKNSANPTSKLIEVQRENAFTTHTYKHTTMGFIKDIEDMPNQYEYSKIFFSRWYRPEKTTLIVAGDVDPEKVIPLVEKYWGEWQRGTFSVDIPQEPPSTGPVYTNVPWQTGTLPYVTVAFHGPSLFQMKDAAALSLMLDLQFGQTSEIYKKLVVEQQKVDQLGAFGGTSFDPGLVTVLARVKKAEDAVMVRDEILKVFAGLRETETQIEIALGLNQAKSNSRYSFVRRLDNTDAIAATIARFAHYERSYDTINKYYRTLAAITPVDIQNTAVKYFTDANLVVTTLSKDPLPAAIAKLPTVKSMFATKWTWYPPGTPGGTIGGTPLPETPVITQKSVLPNVMFKLLFTAGSVNDPKGKEGLAQLAATMVADSGSKFLRIDEINQILYPMAGAFSSQVDKEMTTFTGVVHKDNLTKFLDTVLPQLTSPGLRAEDFQRLKDAQLNALKQDLRNNNEEELGKEMLQNVIYDGTGYGHSVIGTIAGIESITVDDVRNFIAQNYGSQNVVIGLSGDYPDTLAARLKQEVRTLGFGRAGTPIATLPAIAGDQPEGLEVTIIRKDTRATAISMGLPLPITRRDADFAALNIARSWLGEHRMSSSHLYDRIREMRGMNYGDYAYIEYFNRPGGQFFPSPNIGRRSQIFEIWIRPVVPENAQMAMRIALHETQKLIDNGLTKEQFETTRDYLMKNVYLMTSTQSQRLGYALDSWWYGMPEYTKAMRDAYAKLTVDDVNKAVKKYWSAKNLHVVIVTKDAEGLRDALVKDELSTVKYDAPKPQLEAEDKVIGTYKLAIDPAKVRIVNADEVFAK